jgi:hypothetical protein
LGLAGSALAGGGGATIETFPVAFTMTDATCSNLPPGTTLAGSGMMKSITVAKTNNGITRIHNTSHATGTATDQAGNTYVFNYSNDFNVANSAADPATFSGIMNDHFSLAGNGPVGLSNGFQAVFTFGPAGVSLDPLKSRGDPIDFATIAAHCDPL